MAGRANEAFIMHRQNELDEKIQGMVTIMGGLTSRVQVVDVFRQSIGRFVSETSVGTLAGISDAYDLLIDNVAEIREETMYNQQVIDQTQGDIVLQGEEQVKHNADIKKLQAKQNALQKQISRMPDMKELVKKWQKESTKQQKAMVDMHCRLDVISSFALEVKQKVETQKPPSLGIDAMQIVHMQATEALRDEVVALRAQVQSLTDSINGKTAEHLIKVLRARTDEAAGIVNEIDDRLWWVKNNIRESINDVFGGTIDLVQNQQIKDGMLLRLLMWSVVEKEELNRGLPNEIINPNVFGGVSQDHPQFLLFHARRKIDELRRELEIFEAMPQVPEFSPWRGERQPALLSDVLPLTSRPLSITRIDDSI